MNGPGILRPVSFPGIRSCHDLANWMQGVSPAAAEFSKRLLAGCYVYHDLLLGQLLPSVGEDSHLIAFHLRGKAPIG